MNKLLIISVALLFAACNTATPTINTNSVVANSSNSQRGETVIAHSTEDKAPPLANSNSSTGAKTKWTQSGEPIDTKAFDADIAKADNAAKAKPNDPSAKKALGEAYLKRAVALTEARQYASALGDYRRTLKYDPDNAEAKQWVDQIIQIYDSMGRESPPEGQEPPPLPYKPEK
jgi:tetratricopeptide (TPR) repeat protein